jgi:nucleoside-diphosphate-sugar epimerase
VHVVFGAGQVGRALTARLAGLDLAVRVVSRHRPPGLADEVDWRAADATDPEAATDAAKGASVIYQCLNAPYTAWPECFPPLQRGVLSAAERNDALLVSLENIYGYGPTGGKAMTEDLPLAATSVKGRTRVAMTKELLGAAQAGRVRIAIGRASDFFGAAVTESSLGERVFGNAVAGKRADFIGNPDLPHTYSYVPDIAAGLAPLGTDKCAVDGVWHLPGPETVTTRKLLELVAGEVGHAVGVRSVPRLVVRAPRPVQPDDARAGRDVLRVRRAVRARHHQVRVHVRERRHPTPRRHWRDRRVVPEPERLATPAPGKCALVTGTDAAIP